LFFAYRTISDGIKQLQEVLVFLAEDLIQFNILQPEIFIMENIGGEEIGRFIMKRKSFFFARSDDRRQLIKIADQNHLQTAER